MSKPPRRPSGSRPPRPPRASSKRAGEAAAPRARKKSLAPPSRLAIGRVRTIARRTTPPAPRLVQPGFPDVESATRYLLSRAEELVQDGVLPRRPVELYLDALVPVLSFIYARADLFKEANLGPEVCGAVEQIAQELQTMPEAPAGRPSQKTCHTQEAASTGGLLLTAYRDAIRR